MLRHSLPRTRRAWGRDGYPTPLHTALLGAQHGHAYQLGYTGIYGLYKSDEQGGLLHAIASRGAAVLAWDMVGMGSRQQIDGTSLFYRRHRDGSTSRLASMIGELHAALDFVFCASPAAHGAPECLDP